MTNPAYWLGPRGFLVPLPDVASALSVKPEQPQSFSTSIAGTVREQHAPRAARSWSISIPYMSPAERANLEALTLLPRPWDLVTPDAMQHNLLTPRDAGFADPVANATLGGPTRLESPSDLVPTLLAPASLLPKASSSRVIVGTIPVVAGMSVTLSAWVTSWATTGTGSVTFDPQWIYATESGAITPVAVTASSTLTRVSATWTVPEGPPHMQMRITGAGKIVAPAMTWTTSVTDWAPGMGAVVVPKKLPSWDLESPADRTYWSTSFDLQEVGA